jgi:hypothetical protein
MRITARRLCGDPHWEGIKDRLKMTGHKEGVAVGGNLSNKVFEAEGDIESQLPTIRVAYHVLGDKLDFKKLAVIDPLFSCLRPIWRTLRFRP